MQHKKKKIFVIIILLIGLAVLIWLFIDANMEGKLVHNGTLDLSQWDGESIVSLSGKWDFFYSRFMDKNELCENPIPDLEAKFPSVWNGFVVNGEKIGGIGFATYRLHVTGVRAGTSLGMRILPFSTAYSLYIDNELIASSGTVSTSKDGFVPLYQVQTVAFTPKRDEFDIIIHISNYVYARGGAWYTIYFGNFEKINHMSKLIFGIDFFIMSCQLLILAYSLFLFFLQHDKSYLVFTALCTAFLGRTLIKGDHLINYLYSHGNFYKIVWIDYITLYWLPGLTLWVIYNLYSESIKQWIVKLLLIYAAGMTMITIFLPVGIFTEFIYLADIVAIGAGIYGVVQIILLPVSHQSDSYFMIVADTVLTICILHDVFFESNLIATGYTEWSPMGFLTFTVLLLCMFWVRYDWNHRENERILLELNRADERERKLELQFLKSQIRPHFINNALNAIISIARTDAEKARKLLIEFSKYLQNCYSIQNLDDKVPLKSELSFVHAYVVLEQARYPDSLHVKYDVDNIYLMIPPLTLQPLVENAIIHGMKGKLKDGNVQIYVKDCGSFVKVGVMDDGIGIDPKDIQHLLYEESSSIGVGIHNINSRMKRMYNTELYLENCPEGGLNAYIIIPKEENYAESNIN